MKHRRHNLILQYNTMWGGDLETDPRGLPDGWEFTTDRGRYREAGVVIFHIPTMPRFRWPLKRFGQRWVAWSMECDVNYPRLLNPLFMALFDVKMTYRRSADVWVPYLLADMPETLLTPPKPKEPGCLVAWFCRNARERSGRKQYIAEMMKQVDVHAYGPCLQNRRLDLDLGRMTKLENIVRYKFTIAFENSVSDDYVSEKLFDALFAGSVPVYRGARNVDEFLPGERCLINAADFAGPRELADYLRYLDGNEQAYAEYMAWRDKPLRKSFVEMCEGLRETPLARLCRFLSGGEAS